MLVLISFVLVLLAAVLLVLGLLADSGLGLIYGSIAASLVAGALLIAAIRVKPKAEGDAGAPDSSGLEPEPVIPPEPARTSAAAVAAPAAPAAPPAAPPAPTPVAAVVEDDFFPIADYDDLTVAQILPLLPELYADEIGVVRAREESGQGRASILSRLEELREQLSGAPADVTAAELAKKAAPAKAVAKRAAPTKKAAGPAKKAAAKKASTRAAAPAKATAKKATAPARKAPAKKAATRAAAPAKATAKATATAKKATAKKATAKKAPG